MEENKSRATIISTETGEILGYINDGDKILKKESKSYLAHTIPWNFKNYVAVDVLELYSILPELNKNERVFLFSILPFVSYTTCYLQNKNNTDIYNEQLIEIVNLSEMTYYKTLKGLVHKNIIAKILTGEKNRFRFIINPWFINKGVRINKVLKQTFKNYEIRHLNNIKWGDLNDDDCLHVIQDKIKKR